MLNPWKIFGLSMGLWLATGLTGLAKEKVKDKASAQTRSSNETRSPNLRLGVMASFPELTTGTIAWEISKNLSLLAAYAPAQPIHIDVEMPSKKLVERDGFVIRSPQLTQPFDVEFGSHWSISGEWHPWAGSFYLGLGLGHRQVRIKSYVENALILEDGSREILINTRFSAELSSRTEQELLRSVIGQRWSSDAVFWGWSIGLVKPLLARSQVLTQLRILNARASDSADTYADNVDGALEAQEELIRSKVLRWLSKFERMALPLVGLEFGIRF
jgi:hypothetical protein